MEDEIELNTEVGIEFEECHQEDDEGDGNEMMLTVLIQSLNYV
jgi:hypothetical protein